MTTSRPIYIVDDSSDYRFMVQQVFDHYLPEQQVCLFASGYELLHELIQTRPLPGLILLDLHMPGLDGYSTLLQIKQKPLYKQIPIVMVSTASSTEEVNRCYQADANSFVVKANSFSAFKEQLLSLTQYWLQINEESVNSLPH